MPVCVHLHPRLITSASLSLPLCFHFHIPFVPEKKNLHVTSESPDAVYTKKKMNNSIKLCIVSKAINLLHLKKRRVITTMELE